MTVLQHKGMTKLTAENITTADYDSDSACDIHHTFAFNIGDD